MLCDGSEERPIVFNQMMSNTMIRTAFTPFRALAATGTLAAASLFAAQPALADDHSDAGEATEMTKGEERLAKLLEGRVAGEPQRCIRSRLNDRLTVIDETALVYGSGRTIYVQRTRHPEKIDDRDALVSRRFNGSQVCKLDQVSTVDPFNGFFTGVVFFEDFIPYTKVDADEG